MRGGCQYDPKTTRLAIGSFDLTTNRKNNSRGDWTWNSYPLVLNRKLIVNVLFNFGRSSRSHIGAPSCCRLSFRSQVEEELNAI